MKKIRKLTAIQPVSFLPEGREAVKEYCEEAIFYDTEPKDDRARRVILDVAYIL